MTDRPQVITPLQFKQLKEAAKMELQRRRLRLPKRDLLAFIKYTHPGYKAGWVHREICRKLEKFSRDVAAKRGPRLIIQMPPRSGKTVIVSQRFPVWHMGHNPSHDIACCSYGDELAADNSRVARRLSRDLSVQEVFPSLEPGPAVADKVLRWGVGNAGGVYTAVGIGGPLTGRGAHVLIIDDYCKNSKDAESPVVKRSTVEWFKSTARTRLAPGGGIIIMATRWANDDLIGWVLEQMRSGEGSQYDLISFPAIAEKDEEHRKYGEALHPARYDANEYRKIRKDVGARQFAALYQQRPTPEGGLIFLEKHFKNRYHFDPHRPGFLWDRTAISIDCSFKKTDTSDFVSMGAFGLHKGNSYILDRRNERMTFLETIDNAMELIVEWWPQEVLVEEKANGPALIEMLRFKLGQLAQKLKMVPPAIVEFDPKTSKDSRAQASAVLMADGRFHGPADAEWFYEYMAEHLGYKAGAPHDDDVDMTSQMLLHWHHQRTDDPLERARRMAALVGVTGFRR